MSFILDIALDLLGLDDAQKAQVEEVGIPIADKMVQHTTQISRCSTSCMPTGRSWCRSSLTWSRFTTRTRNCSPRCTQISES